MAIAEWRRQMTKKADDEGDDIDRTALIDFSRCWYRTHGFCGTKTLDCTLTVELRK